MCITFDRKGKHYCISEKLNTTVLRQSKYYGIHTNEADLYSIEAELSTNCSGPCKPDSRCRLSKAIFSSGKPQGVGILEWGGDGNGEISLRATWGQGGPDPITSRRVSK
jgi:hypothetical protein